ncbi:phytoene desaturase family protein [Chloroflexota bacterium]
MVLRTPKDIAAIAEEAGLNRKFDAIIIGGGPNGLTAGAYLAKAGQRVLVLERRHEMGGGLATEEVIGSAGFYCNTHAVYMMMADYAPPYKDLELEKVYRLKHVYPPLQFALPLSDGRCLCLHTDVEKSCQSIAKFSKEDAEAYREVYHRYKRYVDEFIAPATYVQPMSTIEQAVNLERTELGREITALSEKTPQEIVNDLFRNEHVRAMMLHIACMWGLDPEQSGVGYLVPLYLNRATNYRMCIGGSHTLAQALIKVILENNGQLRTNAYIKRIMVVDGAATGVELEDGRVYEASKAIISTIDQQQTFLNLVGEDKLDKEFVESVKAWMWEHWSLMGVHLALDEAPDFTAAKADPEINRAFIYLLGYETPEDFINHYKDVGRGELGEARFNCSFPTVHDPTQTRHAGRHIGFISQMAPYALKEGAEKWYSLAFKREQAQKCLETLSRYAPNMTEEKVRNIYVSTPLDVENKFNDMVQGSIKQGQYHPLQMGYMRPNEHCSMHRSPLRNLYMGGSCTYPGGGVLLGSGYLAADAVAEDLGISKWWAEPEMVTKARQNGLI